MFFLSLMVGIVAIFSLEAKSISQHGRYIEYCQIASRDSREFQNFKRNPLYRCILEHATYQQGLEYLNVIRERFPFLLPHLEKLKSNDSIGNPITYSYGEFGSFSPTTLQYIKIAGDLKNEFGDTSNFRIIEIGGGYGGQCKIIHDLDGFACYAIIDLSEPLELTKKYLTTHEIFNTEYFQPDELPQKPEYDLLISNFAFSEIDRDEQIQYLNELIRKVPRGYMIINFIHKFFDIDALSKEEVLSILNNGQRDLKIELEDPPTGDENIVLIWRPLG